MVLQAPTLVAAALAFMDVAPLAPRLRAEPMQREPRLLASMSAVPFAKYHGLGNDFVLLDCRKAGAVAR